jgi:hypothetical protein
MEIWIEVCDDKPSMNALILGIEGTLLYSSAAPESGKVWRHLVTPTPPPEEFSQSPGLRLETFENRFVAIFKR